MKRLRQMLAHVRLKPFDTSTLPGRAKERYRRAGLAAAASVLARSVRVLTQLIAVPMTISYLGGERYGMWLTISSLAAVLVIAKLGVGDGLTTRLAHAHAQRDREGARRDVSTALLALLFTGTATIAVAVLLYSMLPWARFYNVQAADAVAEAGPTSMAFIVCWVASMVFGLINAVNRGHQDGFIDGLVETVASVGGLMALYLLIRAEAALPWLVVAFVGSASIAHLLNWGILLYRRPYLRPSLAAFDRTRLRGILGLGSAYLLVVAGFQIANSSRPLVVSHAIGPNAVPELEIPLRAFAVLSMLFGVIINPLWPAFTESLASKDVVWLRDTLRRVVVLSIAVGLVLSVPLVAGGKQVIHWWVGDAVEPTYLRLALLALWINLSGVNNALGVFLQGVHKVWLRAAVDFGSAIVGVGLMLAFAGSWSIEGVVLGMVLAEGLFRLFPMLLATRMVLREIATDHRLAARTSGPSVPRDEVAECTDTEPP